MQFVIPITPKGQKRARHATVNGLSRTYKDPKQAHEEDALMALLARHKPSGPLQGQLLLGVKAYLPMPKTKPAGLKGISSGTWREAALAGQIRPTTKPDLDNLLKHVKDCLTTLGFWGDGKQVVGYLPHTGKYYSDRPRWEVEIVEFVPTGQEFNQSLDASLGAEVAG